MWRKVIPLFAGACLCLSLPAHATELVTNGSFETGTFHGWTPAIVGSPYIPWLVAPAGNGAGFGMQPTLPQDGLQDAWNGFDGAGPMSFTLYQDINLPRCTASKPNLTWKDRVQWNFALTSTATAPRTYSVQVRPIVGAPVTIHSFSTGTAHVIGDTGWQAHSANLSAFAGSTIRLWFEEKIPEAYTGPGQLEVDAVELVVSDFVSIDDCCSTVPNRVIDSMTGMTLQQFVSSLADRCTVSARNHGDFVSCVTQGLNEAKGGVITGREKGAITSCAARSQRGMKYQ